MLLFCYGQVLGIPASLASIVVGLTVRTGRTMGCRSPAVPCLMVAATFAPSADGQSACGTDTDPDDGASQIEVCVVDRPRYATELFGPGSDALVLGYADEPDNRPKVLLELPERGGGPGDDLAAGSSAVVTLRLTGAEFAERMRASDVVLRNAAAGSGARFSVRSRDGGAAGDRFVAFSVEVGPAGGLGNVGTSRLALALHMPRLTGASDAMTAPSSEGVQVQVSVESETTGRGGFPDFPARRQTRPDGPDADGARDAEDGFRVLLRKPAEDDWALSVARAEGAEGGTIEPEERRLVFDVRRDPAVLTLARVALALRNGPVQADGRPFSVAEGIRGGDGSGVLKVAAAGDFGAGDNIVFDLNSDGKAARPEVLTLTGSLASGVFSLEEVVPGTYSVLYFPGQEAPLRSSAIRTTFVVDFEKPGQRVPERPQRRGRRLAVP